MGILTLRQPQWALPGSAFAACAIGYELLPENKAGASASPEVKADQRETKHQHTHEDHGALLHSEVNTTATTLTTTTLPPDLGVSWDWNPNMQRLKPRASGPHVWNPKPQTTRVVAPLVLVYDRWSGEQAAEVFEALLWRGGARPSTADNMQDEDKTRPALASAGPSWPRLTKLARNSRWRNETARNVLRAFRAVFSYAERQGFEPWVPLRAHWFSRPANGQ